MMGDFPPFSAIGGGRIAAYACRPAWKFLLPTLRRGTLLIGQIRGCMYTCRCELFK